MNEIKKYKCKCGETFGLKFNYDIHVQKYKNKNKKNGN